MAKTPIVILYSVTMHTWEAWQYGRPLGHGSLESCQTAYPTALPVSDEQRRLAEEDTR